MIMAARERTLEYAVLKTLGFSGGHLVGLIAGESLVISAIGAATGVAITYPLVSLIAAFIPKGIFPVFYVEPLTVLLAAIAAILVGIVASVFPIQRAVRTSIVEGLRFIG